MARWLLLNREGYEGNLLPSVGWYAGEAYTTSIMVFFILSAGRVRKRVGAEISCFVLDSLLHSFVVTVRHFCLSVVR